MTPLISNLPSFREQKLCGNDELLLLSLPTKSWWNGKTCFFSKCCKFNLKLTIFIINSTTRKSLQNSKRNCKQHHEQNQSRKARILSAKSGQHKPASSSISVLITAQKMKFSVKDIFPADLIKFFDEILNRKL